MKRTAFAGLAALLLTGCIEEESDGDAAADACGASAMQDIVGLPFDATLLPGGAGEVRVIRPDTAVTMDHRPDRLNIVLDDDDVIEEVRCG